MTKRKIAVSISADLLRAVERLRRETGESRSAVCERALRAYLAGRDARAASQRYMDGYSRRPERTAEVREALTTATVALGLEPWDETQ